MLSKKYRLPVQSILNQRGLTSRSRYFFAKLFAPVKPYSRFGVIVSAKVAPKASGRNMLKRIIYSEIRRLSPQLPIKDYLITAQKGAYELVGNDGIISELNLLLKNK